jgi:hypothetical protein
MQAVFGSLGQAWESIHCCEIFRLDELIRIEEEYTIAYTVSLSLGGRVVDN